MNVDEELLDANLQVEEKRGQTLKVLCILSWVWIGITVIMLLFSAVSGKKTDSQMMEERLEIMNAIPDGPGAEMSVSMYEDILRMSEKSNEYFYELMGLNFLVILLGFTSVFMMFKLKKVGYYIYVLYSILPILVVGWSIGFSGFMAILTIGFSAIISITFLILYGNQLKRMS
ncbi:MAG: hypothetical protein ACI857_003396 [Arenicella sp.]|jgi:hypothetical protein